MAEPLILVNMPFGAIQFPSIQLGILQALAQSAGIPCRSVYANLEFARRIGAKLYNALSSHRGAMLGEWHFALAAFGEDVPTADEFLSRFATAFAELEKTARVSTSFLKNVREIIAPAFIAETADQIVAKTPSVVGLTSTFEQNVASLALARAIKSRNPKIVTLFGGANFDGAMGAAYMKAVPWIDVCVVGEADEIFVPLVEALINGDEPPATTGVLTRDRLPDARAIGRASYEGSMDDLPPPLYDDYFETIARNGLTDADLGQAIVLPFESSRGCWWGQKHHCTFCGLNALGMGFRVKSADKVLDEISFLTQRHRINRFAAVDNILGPKLLNDLSKRLADEQYDYSLFYEIKANLTRDKIRQLHNSGIKHVQPGIESLNTHVLTLMRKGITAVQNVNTLRWMQYYGIEALWNVLYGFPGETSADYARQLQIMRLLHHLPPPTGVSRIWIERFSPIYNQRDAFGFTDVRPERSYEYIYPLAVDLMEASYFFEGASQDTVSDTEMSQTRDEVQKWRHRWGDGKPPFLVFIKTHAGIHIVDGRSDPNEPIKILYRAPADIIYQFCSDQARSIESIDHYLYDTKNIAIDRGSLQQILERFIARGFLVTEDGLYLSLALPAHRPV